MRWHDGWYGSCIYTLTSQHYIIRSKLHLTGGGWTDTTRAYIHRSCRSSLLMDDRMEWGMHTSCWRHDGQDVSSKFDSAQHSTFLNESNSCFSSYFLQAKSSWLPSCLCECSFLYILHILFSKTTMRMMSSLCHFPELVVVVGNE
jgi:hypothetical protein